jgi:formamidopyrimidine-DNA glycosylase
VPELPEVETVVNELEQNLSGRTISSFHCLNKHGFMEQFDTDDLTGATIESVFRKAKYIIFKFKNKKFFLIGHLRMTGKFIEHLSEKDHKHITAEIIFEGGKIIYFVDIRKFGGFSLSGNIEEYFKSFGPEPFTESLSEEYLVTAFKNSNRTIKSLLLDQKIISGIGNIYADESLFLSGIHPETLGKNLKQKLS